MLASSSPSSLPPQLRRLTRGGFTLVEVLVSIVVCAITISAFFAATGQALGIARASRQTALVSQLLQQRVEGLRASPFSELQTAAKVSDKLQTALSGAVYLPGLTETCTVAAVNGADLFRVERAADGTRSTTLNSGDASALSAVELTLSATVPGRAGRPAQTQTLSTVVSTRGL